MTLQPGSLLGSYRIVSPLGAGGMGEVYRAADARLKREVAIKVLPDLFAQDAERMARFEREAQLLAALNHPNIASIYGLEDAGGARCLVLELVEGSTLAERLEAGPLPQDEALAFALQIAMALEAAHEKGIVHRDLKPANVKVTAAGAVKVLDFGLAKALEDDTARGSADVSMSPTLTLAATRVGIILGTAAYMSPEQAKGRPADRRADIWSFGVVLFEMLAGRQLFSGETPSETLAAVMMTPVDWTRLPEGTPPPIRALLGRCLERDPRRRLRDIGEARIMIEDFIAGRIAPVPATAAPAPAPRTARAGMALLGAGLVVGAALAGLGVWMLAPPAGAPPSRRFEIAVPGADSGWLDPRISPDGSSIAYVGEGRLMIRDLAKLEPRSVKTPGIPEFVAWSPDSRWLTYAAAGSLYKVPIAGGESVALSRLTGAFVGGRGVTWGADGRIVFSYGSSGLHEVSERGGDPRVLAAVDPNVDQDFHEPSFLPDGRTLIVVRHHIDTEADTLALFDQNGMRDVFRIPGQRLEFPVYAASGHILYHRTSTNPGIWAVPFSLSSGEVTGEPFLVVAGGRELSVSDDGTLVMTQRGDTGGQQLVWLDRTGKVIGPIGQPQPEIGGVAISPDGLRVAATANEEDAWDVWIHDVRRGTKTKLTFDGSAFAPAWLPGGDRIVYCRGSRGLADMKVKPADGSGDATDLGSGLFPNMTPDGRHVIFALYDHQTNTDIWYRPIASAGEPVAFVRTPAREEKPAISPDGAYLAYVSEESGRYEVYLRDFPGGQGKWQVSANGGDFPTWSPKGDEIVFRGDDNAGPGLWSVEVRTRPTLTLGAPRKLFATRPANLVPGAGRRWDIAPDGQRFAAVQALGGQGPGSSMVVVQNWYAEFSDRK